MTNADKDVLFLLTGPYGEPKITHGHTVVSELSLEEVAITINVRIVNNNYVAITITTQLS